MPAYVFSAAVQADVAPGAGVDVEVRGRLGSASWTTWHPVVHGAAVLDRSVDTVQVQVVLGASSGCESGGPVRPPCSESPTRALAAPAPMTALTSTVYATREGLVGGTTANGHVITPNDHFVALPSRAAIDANGAYDYQVQVCNGATCLTEPVWDVGPWNTRDNYWDTSRAEFGDLPRGKPSASAPPAAPSSTKCTTPT